MISTCSDFGGANAEGVSSGKSAISGLLDNGADERLIIYRIF
jgi:hypothetical protein